MPQGEFRKHSDLTKIFAEKVANAFARKTSCQRSHAGSMLGIQMISLSKGQVCPQRWKLDLDMVGLLLKHLIVLTWMA